MEQNKKLFSPWRVLVLVLLGMLIFNIVMTIFTDSMRNSNLLALTIAILVMTIGGLIITPAPIGLAIYAFSIETLYSKRVFKNYWLFCFFSGILGVTIFVGVFLLLTHKLSVDIRLLLPIFITHTITTMIVYFNKRKDKNGDFS